MSIINGVGLVRLERWVLNESECGGIVGESVFLLGWAAGGVVLVFSLFFRRFKSDGEGICQRQERGRLYFFFFALPCQCSPVV